uniref:hypothetical protein n=1 Tax=Alloprevotella sp. TaxID=1872471 RepID=UPI003FEFFBCE
MRNIDKTIKKLNTALVLLDAFGDGHEFTMHDYEELAATTNELFGGRYSDSNVCYSANWVREHLDYFGIHKTGSRKIEVLGSYSVYKRVYSNYFQHEIEGYAGTKTEPKTVEQFIYRMDTVEDSKRIIKSCKAEIRCEIDNVERRIEWDKQYIETLKKML